MVTVNGEMKNADYHQNQGHTQLYPPSWVDRLSAWIARFPGPSWSYYLGFGLVLFFLLTVVMWIEGASSVGTILPIHFFLSGVIAFFLAMFYYLDKWAGAAMTMIRKDLTADEKKYQELYYQLTTLPRGKTIIASLVILALNFLGEAIGDPYYYQALNDFPVSAYFLRIIYLICFWIFGAFMYHTIHQLSLIHIIYTNHTHIHLFRTKPFYAFSNLSAFTAGSLVMIIYGFLLVNPSIPWDDPIVMVWVVIFIVSALVTFVWPQLGMHRLQVAEQERLLDEAYLRLESTISELHQQLDDDELERMEELNFAIASLEMEINALKKIRTWPWEPETLQLLITALALPLGLWIFQLIFERILGP
jgi:hypothetical protein